MAAKQAHSTKDILQIEQAFALWENIRAYADEHYRELAAAGLVVCILAAGLYFWKAQRAREESDAAALLSTAMAVMSRGASEAGEGTLQYTQALEKFSEISRTHPGTQAATVALLYAGNCSAQLGAFDEAAAYYEKFLDTAGHTLAFMKPYAFEGLGYAHEEKGDYAGAIAWFERQRSEAAPGMQSFAALNLARCFEAAGDRAQACALYRQCREQYQIAVFNDLIKVKIADLCSQQAE